MKETKVTQSWKKYKAKWLCKIKKAESKSDQVGSEKQASCPSEIDSYLILEW